MHGEHRMSNAVQRAPLPLCIVLDTNIWIGEALLRTSGGQSLLHALKQMEAYIGLPEVVETEVPQIQVARFLEVATTFRDAIKKLTQYASDLPAYDLPEE